MKKISSKRKYKRTANVMTIIINAVVAFVEDVFLAIQDGLNGHSGILLKNPLLAYVIDFFSSSFFAILIVFLSGIAFPTISQLKEMISKTYRSQV